MTETPREDGRSKVSEELVVENLQSLQNKVDRLIPHVLQLENAAIFIIGLIVVLQIVDTLLIQYPNAEISKIAWFLPYAALLLVSRVIKILNPYNKIAEITEKGFSYAGAGALAGGSITGLLSGGLGAAAGGAIGGGMGFICGVTVGLLTTTDKKQPTSSPQCKKCQTTLSANDEFCPECGAEHNPKKVCPTPMCKKANEANAKFCTSCGTNLQMTIQE